MYSRLAQEAGELNQPKPWSTQNCQWKPVCSQFGKQSTANANFQHQANSFSWHHKRRSPSQLSLKDKADLDTLFTPQNQHVVDRIQQYTDERWQRLLQKCETRLNFLSLHFSIYDEACSSLTASLKSSFGNL